MLEVLTDDVQARCRSDTSLLADRAVRRHYRHAEPGVIWPVAGCADHGPDALSGQVEPRHRMRDVERAGPNSGQDLTAQAGPVDVGVDGVEKAMHPPVGFAHRVDEIIPE